MAFTKEQQMAIDKEGANIIVSAGAGSGKTAVLTERVIRKLKDGIDVNHLLVLTFTNEAANEMKSRIRKKIIENKLDRQLALLDSAYITTFDSFALSLVKKYNYLINVSDNLKIIDSGIITIYKNKVLDRLFERHYGEPLFDKLITDFCLKDDDIIKKFVLEVSNKYDLLVDKKGYLANYFLAFYRDEYLDELLTKYLKLITDKIDELNVLYDELKYYLDEKMIIKCDTWISPLINGNCYDEYLLFVTKEVPRFPKLLAEGIKLKERFKVCANEIKALLRYQSEADIKESILKTKDYVKVIIDILNELDTEVNKYKDRYNSYEFNDIALMAIQIVRDNLEARKEISEYFNEIMVDEYQDTSTIQETFLSYITHDNLYMVGDIKQSIYRFRNANPYIFQEKYDKYGQGNGGIKIDLNKNFRSRHEVIDNINEIFNLIIDRELGNADYLKEHNMVYGNTTYDEEDNCVDNNLEIYNYEVNKDDEYTKVEKEMFIISEDINNKIKNNYQVLDKETKKLRNLNYGDICIITDRNRYLDDYKKILEYNDIPSVIYTDESLTNNSIVLVIKNLIDLVWHINNKIYDDKFRYVYTSVARSFLFSYPDNQIYHSLKNKQYDEKIIALARSIDLGKPITEVINEIISKYDVYSQLLILPDIEKNIIMIDNLIDISNNLSSLGYSLKEFISYLDDTLELDLPVKYTVNTKNDNAIKIMNIHKSKGLEFCLCYFVGMDNRFTIKEIKSKQIVSEKYGIIMPYMHADKLDNTILYDLYVNDFYREEISEKLRLFYVELTRCREKMIILASLDMEADKYNRLVPYHKRIKYRSFLDILNSLEPLDKYVVYKEAKCTKDYRKITLKDIVKNDKQAVITKKKLNITYQELHSGHFSKDNQKFLDINKLNDMEYGTKIHKLFEYSDFANADNQYVKNLTDLLPTNYLNTYHEYEFSYSLNGITYRGIIDLIVEYDEVIYIIDYKLKDTSDESYLTQLAGYQEYISSITHKPVKTYLYSVIDNYLTEVKNEK